MNIIGDEEFLVLTKKVSTAIAIRCNAAMPEQENRKILLAVINRGHVHRQFDLDMGLQKVVRSEWGTEAAPCEIVLSYGRDQDGNPKLSPDGKRQVVYAVRLTFPDLTRKEEE